MAVAPPLSPGYLGCFQVMSYGKRAAKIWEVWDENDNGNAAAEGHFAGTLVILLEAVRSSEVMILPSTQYSRPCAKLMVQKSSRVFVASSIVGSSPFLILQTDPYVATVVA